MPLHELVTRVIDGDTFVTENRIVRIANVNTPEKGEPGFRSATSYLKALVMDECVILEEVAHDIYGRMVANVYVGDIAIGPVIKLMTAKDNSELNPTSNLQASVGNQCVNRRGDVVWVKSALQDLKLYSFKDSPNGYIDQALDQAIKVFQQNNHLKVDGNVKPEGETEMLLRQIS